MNCPICGHPNADLYTGEHSDEMPVCVTCNDARIYVRERVRCRYWKAREQNDNVTARRLGRDLLRFFYGSEV